LASFRPGSSLTGPELWSLVRLLLAGPAGGRSARAAAAVLALLGRVDDRQLAGLYDEGLRELLEQAIPDGNELRDQLAPCTGGGCPSRKAVWRSPLIR
jgi:hypothetical protein